MEDFVQDMKERSQTHGVQTQELAPPSDEKPKKQKNVSFAEDPTPKFGSLNETTKQNKSSW